MAAWLDRAGRLEVVIYSFNRSDPALSAQTTVSHPGWVPRRNLRNVASVSLHVAESLDLLVKRLEPPLALVNRSLGSLVAHEGARDQPDLASRVITIGSPVLGGPKYTSLTGPYKRRGVQLDDIEATILNRYDVPLKRPVRAIYSEDDGIVSWQATIDRFSTDVKHIRVPGPHVGLGFSKRVLRQLPALLVGD